MAKQCDLSSALLLKQLRLIIERLLKAIHEIDLSHPKRAVVADFISHRVKGVSSTFN
jgi:hypothetical protein